MDEIRETFISLFSEIVSQIDNNKLNKRNLLIERIYKIIEENYHNKNLSMRSIADELQLSSDYLGKQFKEMTGKSVADHITNVRLNHIKQLLDTSNLSTKDILDKCGLEETNYFHTLFKKKYGMTFSQYRLSEKNAEE